ncbi:MAG: type II secretion system minor pseudopilin GspJ [Pseudomonadota bacterium]
MNARSRGFTLLELVVALAVFAVLATLAYGSLARLLQARDTLAARAEALGRLQRVQAQLARDCGALVARPARDELGDPEPALRRAPDGSLELTQGAFSNPLDQPRAQLQRVRWQVRGGVLYRDAWPVLDRVPGTRPQAQRLLDGVQRFTVGIETGVDSRAVSVELDAPPFGAVEWLFLVPEET